MSAPQPRTRDSRAELPNKALLARPLLLEDQPRRATKGEGLSEMSGPERPVLNFRPVSRHVLKEGIVPQSSGTPPSLFLCQLCAHSLLSDHVRIKSDFRALGDPGLSLEPCGGNGREVWGLGTDKLLHLSYVELMCGAGEVK